MSEWKAWCRGHGDLTIEGDTVEVRFKDERGHRVRVEKAVDGWTLTAKIASGSALGRLGEPEVFVWERNRTSQLVGFRIEKNDRLIGEAWVPEEGSTDDEFLLYLRTLAAEADRLEALLTGQDDE